MKLTAGLMLFALCALMGERASRALSGRERTLGVMIGLIRRAGDRQIQNLCSLSSALKEEPAGPEQQWLLALSCGEIQPSFLPLSKEEEEGVRRFAALSIFSPQGLRQEQETLVKQLSAARQRAMAERAEKGRIYRSMGYLSGVAALLLVV